MKRAAFLPFFPLLSSSPASPVPAMGRPRVGSGWKVRREQLNELERAAVTAALAAVARRVHLFATGAPRASIYSPRARHGRPFIRHGRRFIRRGRATGESN